MNVWKNWLAQCLKNELNWGFHTHNSWHRVYLSVCPFLSAFKTLNQIPVTFRHAEAVARIYRDIEIKFCQLFQHPHNWRYSSVSQHEIPVLSTNLIVHFQTFETFISRLKSVLAFAIIFYTISKNKHHKIHLAITPLITVGSIKMLLDFRTRNVFGIVPYKTDRKNVTGYRVFQWKTDTQKDALLFVGSKQLYTPSID